MICVGLLRNKQWVIQREACLEMARVYLVAMLSLDLLLHSFRPFFLLELFHYDGDDDKKDGDSHPDEHDERGRLSKTMLLACADPS